MPEGKTVIAGSWDNNMYVCIFVLLFNQPCRNEVINNYLFIMP